ncbi:lipocalin family protein [Dysgonomonas sp. 25]|uniref:lipocalin family protein n=1 Tax=Dysgonomonas sp. 25 TaxID=2302933 RepID=UPI0013D59E6F|nr:lipocalin family protein [Dysgonomonas sp. 25]NDV69124.1 hypothetical protein [Dysgonomonas sp. 25]
MKLNKLFFILLSVALMAGFSSCSDDDDYSANDLVGTWKCIENAERVTTSNSKATALVNALLMVDDNDDDDRITFNEDLTFVDEESSTYQSGGTYRVSGNKIYLKYTGESEGEPVKITSLSKTNFSILFTADLNETLVDYLNYNFSSRVVDELTASLQAVGVDITTITVKSVKYTSTYTKVTAQ